MPRQRERGRLRSGCEFCCDSSSSPNQSSLLLVLDGLRDLYLDSSTEPRRRDNLEVSADGVHTFLHTDDSETKYQLRVVGVEAASAVGHPKDELLAFTTQL